MAQCYIDVENGTRHKCDNCGEYFDPDELDMITDIQERLTPGGVVPSGQCPECGGLTYQIDPDDDGDESVDVVKKAIQDHVANYGEHAIDVAYDKMVEEVGELLVAMRHHQRGRAGEEAVIEELADVALLTLLIASLHEAGPEIKRITEMKAKRFSNRLVKNKVAGGMVC
jgi:NTP pyrophosphatase (non-canonical NTP hydrolase)/predicted RNA-binding Zn-ribbon protein involved in translation (DUF1610 family)